MTSHGRGVSPDRSGAQKSEITACCAPLQSWGRAPHAPPAPRPRLPRTEAASPSLSRPLHSATRFTRPPSASVCPPPLTETPAARLRAHPSPGPSPLKSLSADPISDILKFGWTGSRAPASPTSVAFVGGSGQAPGTHSQPSRRDAVAPKREFQKPGRTDTPLDAISLGAEP